MIEENEIQYFAGGATWDNEDKTQEFLDENKWQNGYAQDTEEPSGKRSYNVINRISKGDMFALKALSGQNNIKIIAIGEVFSSFCFNIKLPSVRLEKFKHFLNTPDYMQILL